ncbi:ABC transporter substrate-binding protein [bacterium]|nr:ABC transporter substrate-binding protein [bacterium]
MAAELKNRCVTDRRRFSLQASVLIGLALAFSQSACQPKRQSERLTVASAGRLSSVDPALASTTGALQVLSALGDTLYIRGNNGDFQPQLAASKPEVSGDGLSITIPLRRDVLFHDGSRFDAKAMAFSLNRFLRIGSQRYLLSDRIEAIETPNTFEIRLRLKQPSSSIESLLTSPYLTPVSPKAYADHADRFLNDRFVGTGPYTLSSFRNTQQRLLPFGKYWGTPPNNVGLDLINLSNSTALFGALVSGEVDVLLSNSIDEDQKRALSERADKRLLRESKGPATNITFVTLRTNSPPLQSQTVRRALAHSIDRRLISARVSYSQREPLRSLIPPGLRGGKTEPWPTYNLATARKLFQQAGYCSGRRLQLPFTFRTNVPSDRLMALTWQAQLKRDLPNCIQMTLNGVESAMVYEQLSKGSFEAVILDWGGSYPDPEAYITPLLSCKLSEGNICKKGEAVGGGTFWAAPGLQTALRRSDSLQGKARLKELASVDAMAAEGAPYIPVWFVAPKAWAQLRLNPPIFNGNGLVNLAQLGERR